jgi:hypothetical protein
MCTTYTIAFLFAITDPIVTMFAVPFFLFKYYVDKYNLTFVYDSKQHGKGLIARKLMPLTVFGIMFSQVLNASIHLSFLQEKKDKFYQLGLATLIIEISLILVYKLYKLVLRYSHATKRQSMVQLLSGNFLRTKENQTTFSKAMSQRFGTSHSAPDQSHHNDDYHLMED